MGTQSSSLLPKESILEKLTKTVYLDYVLKILGIVMFGLAFFNSWHGIAWTYRMLMVFGVLAWFVGARFTKIYR